MSRRHTRRHNFGFLFSSLKKLSDVTIFALVVSWFCISLYFAVPVAASKNCDIPYLMQGEWYSFEGGSDKFHTIEANWMEHKGICVDMMYHDAENVYRNFFVFDNSADGYNLGNYFYFN